MVRARGTKALISRLAHKNVVSSLEHFKVTCVSGPRQCGKSTLIRQFADKDRAYFDLDNKLVREAISNDITEFLQNNHRAIIDEVHRVPDLLTSIKSSVDETSDERGRYIISSSLSYETLARREDSLAGRVHEIHMLPLSQCEINGARPGFIDLAANHPNDASLPTFTVESQEEFFDRATRGYYPEAVTAQSANIARLWTKDYLDLIAKLDYKEEGNSTVSPETVIRALEILARIAGSTVSVQNLSEKLLVSYNTAKKIIATLVRLRLVALLPVQSQYRKHKKVLFHDSGVLSHLLGVSQKNIHSLRRFKSRGSIFETFVYSELIKQVHADESFVKIECHRDKSGREIDFVLTLDDDSIIAIEAKASGTVSRSDFKNITHFANNEGDRFVRGIIMYFGEWSQNISLPKGDPLSGKLWVLPVSSLYSDY